MLERAIRKAQSSICREKVSAIGLDRYGRILGVCRNDPRFERKGGGKHAEMNLMRRFDRKIKTIIICRTNASGDLLKIDPCPTCAKKAEELGIKIYSIQEVMKKELYG
jgi:tRNA(Arg) A34 adenosine deaminase TadA